MLRDTKEIEVKKTTTFKNPPLIFFENHTDTATTDCMIQLLSVLPDGYRAICIEASPKDSLHNLIARYTDEIQGQLQCLKGAYPNLDTDELTLLKNQKKGTLNQEDEEKLYEIYLKKDLIEEAEITLCNIKDGQEQKVIPCNRGIDYFLRKMLTGESTEFAQNVLQCAIPSKTLLLRNANLIRRYKKLASLKEISCYNIDIPIPTMLVPEPGSLNSAEDDWILSAMSQRDQHFAEKITCIAKQYNGGVLIILGLLHGTVQSILPKEIEQNFLYYSVYREDSLLPVDFELAMRSENPQHLEMQEKYFPKGIKIINMNRPDCGEIILDDIRKIQISGKDKVKEQGKLQKKDALEVKNSQHFILFGNKSNQQIHNELKKQGYFIGNESLRKESFQKAKSENREKYRYFISMLSATNEKIAEKENSADGYKKSQQSQRSLT